MTWLVTRATFEGNNVRKAKGTAQNSQAQLKQRLRLNRDSLSSQVLSMSFQSEFQGPSDPPRTALESRY